MGTKIGDNDLIRILSSGDIASNEIFYHKENIKPSLANFHRKYQTECKNTDVTVNKDDIDWLKVLLWIKFIFTCMKQKCKQNPVFLKIRTWKICI